MNRCAGTGSLTGEKRASRCLLVGAHPHKPTVAHREDHLSWCCELVEWKEILEWFCLTRVAVQDKVAALHRSTLKKIGRIGNSLRVCLRTACVVATLIFLHSATEVRAQERFNSPGTAAVESDSVGENARNCRIIYLGFVGALEPPNNKHSGVVQIRKTLEGKGYPDVCANSFSPYVWMEGRDWLMKHFPAHTGPLTAQELQKAPKVILVGHSMGGWAMMSVARELRSRDIPVELTVQVDSVGITDYTIPRNVKSAAIFHANDALMFLTTKHLRREDASRTTILENVTVAGAGHESITRDPRIRELVMEEVESLRTKFAASEAATRAASEGAAQK